MKGQKLDPRSIELLDVWNEVGGQMIIHYHTATIKPTKEQLQALRDNNIKTNVMNCIMTGLIAGGLNQKDTIDFIELANEIGAAPSVTFEAKEGETLNIKSREENPMVDMLIQGIRTANE